MIIDCHVHVVATTPGHGSLSRRLLKKRALRFIRRRLGLTGDDGEPLERGAEAKLVETIDGAEMLDAVVVLAFDAVHDRDGKLDRDNTHLYVTNDYVWELAQRHPKVLFGASVHPYRNDAVAELERCVARGAVLVKWLPIVQNFNPADGRCLPFYEALAHHRIPLLAHTGGEQSLPTLDRSVADPALLVPALRAGVTVIACHCGTRARPFERDYTPTFMRMAHEYEHLYGDTAALNLPMRSYAYKSILEDPVVRAKLVHGSDWPIISIPPRRIGWLKALRLFGEQNWMRRDVLAKQQLGLEEAYWHRAGTLLRLAAGASVTSGQGSGGPSA
ncbi:MAG TPA: amidohydrolase family protein [Gemmataceae bacterium]|jgi:predicted TIM-barrel fold metal-dependent hydrolase|nr:amidohydrolase family protein [Gemmataceae bacterium]